MKPICTKIGSDEDQLCAKFTTINPAKPPSEGDDGCLVVETVFRTLPKEVYDIGCFNFNGVIIRKIENVGQPER